MAEITRDQFSQKVIEIVRGKFPLVKIARGDLPFSMRVNEQTVSLENLYRLSTLRPEEVQHHVERWMVELIRAGEGTPDRMAQFDEVKDRIFPMLVTPNSGVQQDTMVSQPLVADLSVVYAIDSDRTLAYVPQHAFDRWNLTVDELHEVAIANLISRSEAIQAHAAQDESGKVNLILFQTMDGFDASRLLLPTLHERLREHLGTGFVAGVPNRDILLCFRDDEQTVESYRKQIQQDFRSMPHPVTDHLLLVSPDGISERVAD